MEIPMMLCTQSWPINKHMFFLGADTKQPMSLLLNKLQSENSWDGDETYNKGQEMKHTKSSENMAWK